MGKVRLIYINLMIMQVIYLISDLTGIMMYGEIL